MGPDDLVLGYPWFAATNVQPNWTDGTLPTSITIRTRGAASGKPMPPLKVAGTRNKVRKPSFMEDDDELYIRIIKMGHLAKTTVAQQLAEQATDKMVRSWDQIVPSQYHQHAKVFSKTAAHRFPESRQWDHAIDLKGDAPSTMDCKVYPLSPGEDTALQTFLSENLTKGYIRPSKSPYAFPFFFIKKKNGDLRPVQDYRRLNAFTVRNTAPLPLIQELMDRLTRVHGCRSALFTKLDIRWGYNNIRIRDGDQWKAAFKMNRGLFEPMVMFFGLTNAPATFQSMMNFIFHELINEGYVTIYMDDILIHTPNDVGLHRRVINNVLRILANNDLYLKPQKCQFEVAEVEYLGVIISEDRIAMDPIKVNGVKNWKQPTTLWELRAFLGFLNFYRMYIRNFSLLAAPLNMLVTFCAKGGKFHWEYEHESAFQALVDAVCMAPILRQPRFEDPFVVDCDTSAYAIGAVLQQEGEKGKLHPIAFLSQTLDVTQQNWDIYDKELYAVIHALETWRPYLVGNVHKTLISTDHNNLTYFKAA